MHYVELIMLIDEYSLVVREDKARQETSDLTAYV